MALSIQNQQTISFLKTKNFCSAVESASTALRMHQERRNSIQRQDPQHCIDITLNHCMLRSKAGQEGCDVYIPPLTYIYTDGVALPQGPVDFPTTTSILIFNAAIANHLFARVQGRKEASLRYLRKAKKLYVLAHEGQENSDVNFLFHIAIINNLAMVDLAIGDLESAHKSFEYMVSLMMLQLDQGYDLSSHLHDFLSNIPIAIKAAPAA